LIETQASAREVIESEDEFVDAQADVPGFRETEPADPQDQRSHRRFTAEYDVNIEASLSLMGHEVMRLELTGTTTDISRGGMLIRVNQEVLPGARCDVRFVDTRGRIAPDRVTGRVRRSSKVRNAFSLAMEFDQPLDRLDI
jgi:hypothetical protein